MIYRPTTQSGRPLSGVVRPGSQSGRPGTMDQALRTPRTAHTARPVSAASGKCPYLKDSKNNFFTIKVADTCLDLTQQFYFVFVLKSNEICKADEIFDNIQEWQYKR